MLALDMPPHPVVILLYSDSAEAWLAAVQGVPFAVIAKEQRGSSLLEVRHSGCANLVAHTRGAITVAVKYPAAEQ